MELALIQFANDISSEAHVEVAICGNFSLTGFVFKNLNYSFCLGITLQINLNKWVTILYMLLLHALVGNFLSSVAYFCNWDCWLMNENYQATRVFHFHASPSRVTSERHHFERWLVYHWCYLFINIFYQHFKLYIVVYCHTKELQFWLGYEKN